MNDRDTRTYVLRTLRGAYYCGKTVHVGRRMNQHKKGKGWFKYKDRKRFVLLFVVSGDYEKNIKSFGVQKFYECFIKGVSLS